VAPLLNVMALLRPDSVRTIPWSQAVFCTSNFRSTLLGPAPQKEYLRPVRAMLLFPQGQVLLVSEREADALLELLWQARPGGGAAAGAVPLLQSLSYAKLAFEGAGIVPVAPRLACSVSAHAWHVSPGRACAQASAPVLVTLQLFDGDTMYGTLLQRRELQRLMRRRLEAAQELTGMRGKQSLLPRSHLERVCEDVMFDA
jgi:hypothetical protein